MLTTRVLNSRDMSRDSQPSRYAALTFISPNFYDVIVFENRSVFARVAPGTERLLLWWFHVRSASFSPHPDDVVYRVMQCTWDVSCRANQDAIFDNILFQYNVAYPREISALKKRISSNPPVWDLGPALNASHTTHSQRGALIERAMNVTRENQALFDLHAAMFRNLIVRIQKSNVTSDGALENNLQEHFIYHSIMAFNCIAMSVLVGIALKCSQFVTGTNIMQYNNVRRLYICFCLLSLATAFFASKLTIVLPYHVSATCMYLTSTLSKLQSLFGLHDTSDFFQKSLKVCPLKSVKYEHMQKEAEDFGHAPFLLQMHKLFITFIYSIMSSVGFWDSGEVALSLFIGFQFFYGRYKQYVHKCVEWIKGFTSSVAFGEEVRVESSSP
jgi:hypothetical protein